MSLLVVVVVAGPSSVAVDCPSYSGLACLVAFRPAQRGKKMEMRQKCQRKKALVSPKCVRVARTDPK